MKRRCGSILTLGIAVTCLTATALAAAQAASPGVREITMTAKNYEFDPSVITAKKGDKLRLIITATDRDHGIKIDGYDINQVLKKGDPQPSNLPPIRPARLNSSVRSIAAWATGK